MPILREREARLNRGTFADGSDGKCDDRWSLKALDQDLSLSLSHFSRLDRRVEIRRRPRRRRRRRSRSSAGKIFPYNYIDVYYSC
jgi:hypothetical protein